MPQEVNIKNYCSVIYTSQRSSVPNRKKSELVLQWINVKSTWTPQKVDP